MSSVCSAPASNYSGCWEILIIFTCYRSWLHLPSLANCVMQTMRPPEFVLSCQHTIMPQALDMPSSGNIQSRTSGDSLETVWCHKLRAHGIPYHYPCTEQYIAWIPRIKLHHSLWEAWQRHQLRPASIIPWVRMMCRTSTSLTNISGRSRHLYCGAHQIV